LKNWPAVTKVVLGLGNQVQQAIWRFLLRVQLSQAKGARNRDAFPPQVPAGLEVRQGEIGAAGTSQD